METTNKTTTVSVHGPAFERSCKRLEIFVTADRDGILVMADISVDLERTRDGFVFVTRWTCNNGRVWFKGHKATFKTEAEAVSFANAKLPVIVAHLETKIKPESFGGCAQFLAVR